MYQTREDAQSRRAEEDLNLQFLNRSVMMPFQIHNTTPFIRKFVSHGSECSALVDGPR